MFNQLKHPIKLAVAMVVFGTMAGAQAASKPQVVVSFQPYGTITQNIAGDLAQVTVLLPAGRSPHTYDPTPADMRNVANAKLAILNGGGIDDWLKTLIRSSGSRANTIELTKVLKYTALAPSESHTEADAHGHDDHGAMDPHIWLDAAIMAKASSKIGAELAKIDPKNAQYYQNRAKLETNKLLALHQELQKTLLPIRKAKTVTFHGAWTYFSAAYGPQVIATIEPFPGKEPSAKYVARVVKAIRAAKVKAVFAEPTLPQNAAQALADSAGVRLAVIAPEGDAKISDYYQMMRNNAQVLLKYLR